MKTLSASVGLSRRRFLLQNAALATTLGAAMQARSALAIDPFQRSKPGTLKLSLAAYSFRQALTRPPDEDGSMTLYDLVNFCREHLVPGVELTSYYFPEDFDDAYLLDLRRHCHLQGVTISGGAIRNDFCVGPDELEMQLRHVRKWIDAYAVLGAPVIRIFAGAPPKGVSREEAIARCQAACEKACEYAAEKGIFLALENHHGITDTADSMLEVVRAVDSPWFGVNFDSGNFKVANTPYEELKKIAPFSINAQIKVEIWRDGKKVPADLERIVGILKSANYGGWVVLEYEDEESPKDAIPDHLAELKTLL